MARQMKDSGIEWIGEIPETWDRCHLLNILRGSITDGPHETPDLVDSGVPFISIDSLNESETIDFTVVKKYISEEDYLEYSKKAILEEGDILFSKSATIGKTAIIGKEKFMIWSPLAIVKPNNKYCDTKFLYHVLNCKRLIEYASLQGSYNTQFNLGMRVLEKVFVPIPSLAEQKKIADYLDRQCAHIDTVIEKTKASIEEYKKLKHVVITEAVTKGVRGERPMKDSGMSWIGEIPKEWTRCKLSDVSSAEKYSMVDGPFGSDMKNEEYVDEGVPIIQLTNIKPMSHYTKELKYVTEEKATQLSRHIAYAGDLVIAKMMPAGRACIISDMYDKYIVAADAIRCKCSDEVDKRFVMYCLNTYCMEECILASRGTTRVRISLEIARRLKLFLPSLSEQKEIANYIDQKLLALNKIIEMKEQTLVEMELYKKSLIYECVTGKREV